MQLYHQDRAGTLRSGVSINLTSNDQLPVGLRNATILNQLKCGLSQHGLLYLEPTCTLEPFIISQHGEIQFPAGSVKKQTDMIGQRILEYGLELVRAAYFPQYPSRFQCLFGLGSLNDFDQWPELTQGVERRIFEISVPDDTPRFDSSFLRGGLPFGFQGQNYYIAFDPIHSYEFAVKYWSGAASDSPRWEYLIPLPISGDKVRGISLPPQTARANHPQ